MPIPSTVSVIIPVYNEQRTIGAVMQNVVDAPLPAGMTREIIVVDDGSDDGTAQILKAYAGRPDVKVISHAENFGKTRAIVSALGAATGDIVLVQDADLEYSPQDYPRILALFLENNAQVVYGSRFLRAQWPMGMRPANWLANKIFTRLVNLLYRSAITDEGTAYKAFRREILNAISIESAGFAFCAEVTAKLLKRGVPILEVPVAYTARKTSEGKKPGIRDGISILKTIIWCRFAG